MEKVVLKSLHQKWLGLAVMGKYHSILLMLFNLAFLMKCKYKSLLTESNWSFVIGNGKLIENQRFVLKFTIEGIIKCPRSL